MFNINKSKTEEKSVASASPSAMTEIENYFSELEKKFFGSRWPFGAHLQFPQSLTQFDTRIPNIDLIDRDKEFLVKAELPGIDKNDIEINLTDRSVTIKGEKKQESKEEKDNYFHQEISRASFCRSVALPTRVDKESAKANFKDGVLEITVAKLEPTESKKISVS